jgi:hypothetical protein
MRNGVNAMRRPKKQWIVIGVLGALFVLLSCAYPAGYALRQSVEGPVIPGGLAPVGDEPGVGATPSIGQRVEAANGVAFTVQSVERVAELDGIQAEPGNTFVIADVLVENGSDAAIGSVVRSVQLYGPGAYLFASTSLSSDDALSSGMLEPGEQVQGRVAFAGVPEDMALAEMELSFAPPMLTQEGMAIDIALMDNRGDSVAEMPPPQEVAQREPVPVGETISDAGVTLTVLSAERSGGFEGAEPDPGQVFLIVEIQLENNSEDTIQTAGGFRLVDSTGNEYTRDLGLDPSEVEFGFLAIGSTTQGRLPFIIPESATDLMLIYEPMEFMMWDVAPFRIAIDETAPVAEEPGAPAEEPGPPAASTTDAPAAGAQVATVTNGGNIRSEVRVAADTVLGQVCLDDQVEILEEQSGWYRVRIFATAGDCVPQRVGAGTEGWISATLLSQPTAYTPPEQAAEPTEEPTEAPAAEPTEEPTEAPAAEPTEEPTEAPAAEPTEEPTEVPADTPLGTVNNGGNLRSDTAFAADTVIGQVCPGDRVAILQEREAEGILWYQIRVTELAADCHPERVALDTEGWLSSILVDR